MRTHNRFSALAHRPDSRVEARRKRESKCQKSFFKNNFARRTTGCLSAQPKSQIHKTQPCAHVWASHSLGDFVVQRSIQTQLSYYASLRNEPGGNWLASFQDQRHLDSRDDRARTPRVKRKRPTEGETRFSLFRERVGMCPRHRAGRGGPSGWLGCRTRTRLGSAR